MNVRILEGINGAKQAKGIVVIIDVFRAFTTEAYLMHQNVQDLLAVADKEIAYQYKKDHPNAILIGERSGKMLPGFAYGNSPFAIKDVDFSNCCVVHTTSAGTQGISNAIKADEVLSGSFVNANAIVKYIQHQSPQEVSLVAMGLNGIESTDEDLLCANYLKARIQGDDIHIEKELRELAYTSGAKFFDSAQQDVFPKEDFELCIACDVFPFVLKATREQNYFRITKIDCEDFKEIYHG